jgi:hypothetical protein
LENQFPKAGGILESAEADVLAHTAFPRANWRKIASAAEVTLTNTPARPSRLKSKIQPRTTHLFPPLYGTRPRGTHARTSTD